MLKKHSAFSTAKNVELHWLYLIYERLWRLHTSRYRYVIIIIEMKWNEKLLMRLNPRCPELRGAAKPNKELTLGTTSWSSSEERRLRVLFKGLSRLCRYTGLPECITLYVRVHSLYFILNWTGSPCRDFNKGVTLQNRGERVTTLAKQFWTLCTLFISRFGML